MRESNPPKEGIPLNVYLRWAIPVCLLFSWIYLRPKYHWTQILGALICMGGLGLLVASDSLTDKDYPAISMVKGDIFMIVGASLYGFSAFILHHNIYIIYKYLIMVIR